MASGKLASVASTFSATSVPSAFDLYHAGIPAFYLLAVLVMTMAVMQPVVVVLSLVAAIAYSVVLRGGKATAKMLAWQLPLLLLIGIANPLFSAAGTTIMFQIGQRAFYLEALIYGLTSGAMLVAVMIWFANLTLILNADRILALGGRVLPTVSLMASMVMRLVPQFVRRGTQVSDAQRACTVAAAASSSATSTTTNTDTGAPAQVHKRQSWRQRSLAKIEGAVRQSSILMEWGMEDSLEMADAMKARGWGASRKRSSYQLQRFHTRDGVLLAVMVLLVALSIVGLVTQVASFTFYPQLSGWAHPLAYVPLVLFLAIPFVLELGEWLRWR